MVHTNGAAFSVHATKIQSNPSIHQNTSAVLQSYIPPRNPCPDEHLPPLVRLPGPLSSPSLPPYARLWRKGSRRPSSLAGRQQSHRCLARPCLLASSNPREDRVVVLVHESLQLCLALPAASGGILLSIEHQIKHVNTKGSRRHVLFRQQTLAVEHMTTSRGAFHRTAYAKNY